MMHKSFMVDYAQESNIQAPQVHVNPFHWHSSLKLCDPLGLLLSFMEIGFNTFFGVIGT